MGNLLVPPSKCKNAFPEEERGRPAPVIVMAIKYAEENEECFEEKLCIPRALYRVRGHSFGERVNGGRPWEVLPQIVDSFPKRVQLCTQLNLA